MRERADVFEFVGIGELAETLTQYLSLSLQYTSDHVGPQQPGGATGLEKMQQLILQQAKDHLTKVREGFVLSVRTAQVTDRSEIRYLLDRVLLDWEQFSRELGLEDEANTGDAPADQASGSDFDHPAIEHVRHQLLAYSMAAVALGHLPRLPSSQITFPRSYSDPPTYSDISAPDSPGEMLVRIEEIEQMLWQIMVNDLGELVKHRYGPLRRTYGFFEASAWLARKEAERFGIKKRETKIVFF
jgi:hypothetical protein